MKKGIGVVGRVSSESVEKNTGRGWAAWVATLNKAGAKNWSHQEIVAYLKKKQKLSPWWQQMVTVGYEVLIGRREEGRNQKGEYSVAASRTMPVAQRELWNALTSPEGVEIWLKVFRGFKLEPGAKYETRDGAFGEVRTMKAPLRIRMTWQDADWDKPSVLQLYAVARLKGKSVLAIQQEGLSDGRLRDRLREHWKQAMERILELIREKSA
ncbi:MAG TPA: SRPBCC domain-containing protein [Bdellovibrionales bacterium]|nr:SRPBCC domain-containing protein [Bdellovibrionales bacterium]